jgi:hypothetical protein
MIQVGRSLAAVLVVLVVAGCSPKVQIAPHQRPEQKIDVKEGVWQQAWVDPSVVYSDSIFTLIRANRIDSFLVAPGKLQLEIPDITVQSSRPVSGTGAIKFQIQGPSCGVSVALAGGSVDLAPIKSQNLPTGYYKLTCDLSGGSARQLPAGNYRVRVTFCGQNRGGTLLKP